MFSDLSGSKRRQVNLTRHSLLRANGAIHQMRKVISARCPDGVGVAKNATETIHQNGGRHELHNRGDRTKARTSRGGSRGAKNPVNKPKIEHVCVAQLDRATAS